MIFIIPLLVVGSIVAVVSGKESLYRREEKEKMQQLKEVLEIQNTILATQSSMKKNIGEKTDE